MKNTFFFIKFRKRDKNLKVLTIKINFKAPENGNRPRKSVASTTEELFLWDI